MHFESAVQTGHIVGELGMGINDTEQLNCKGTVMWLLWYIFGAILGRDRLSTSEKFPTTLTFCFLRMTTAGERGLFSLSPVLRSDKGSVHMTKKSGTTDDLTPPVNSDFSQPVITCSANSCD